MQTEWDVDTSRLGLLRRATNTLLLARRIHKKVKALENELKELGEEDDDDVKIERWDELHRENAKAVYQHILKYKGFLAKAGQAISANGGNVPGPWREELRSLQDALPVSSFKEVKASIKAAFHRPLDEIFIDFEERPIASATVGQAHVAYLRTTGQKVCVKVQHKGVGKIMAVDLRAIEYIAKKAIQSHKDAPDFTPLILEWKRASREEVDFSLEAANARRAAECFARNGIDVKCPAPIDSLCGANVMTMEFIEGCKVTEIESFPSGTNLEDLAKSILKGFALLVFDEGLIHGDPHPGNVFVESVRGGARPVFLDWGIVRALTREERFCVARWTVATMTRDRLLFLSALKDLGYVFSDEFDTGHLDEWMNGSAFLFRDSIPRGTADYLFAQFDNMDEKRETAEKTKKEAEKEQQKKKKSRCSCACSCTGKSKSKKPEPKKLVEKIPGVVLFFVRALGMLQGVCSSLGVTVTVAEPFLHYAISLLEASSAVPATPWLAPEGCSGLELALRNKLQELVLQRHLVGVQIAVLRNRATSKDWLCNIAFGKGGISGDPVSRTTLMPLLDVGVGVLVTLLLGALSRRAGRKVGLETPVSDVWPEFQQQGRGAMTIAQALQHTAKLERPFSRKKISLKKFCDEKAMEETIAACPQAAKEDSGACPVLGILLAGLLRRATGHKCVADALKAALEPLGLHEDIVYHVHDDSRRDRMAAISRRPMHGLSLAKLFEYVEEQQQKLDVGEDSEPSAWLNWHELGQKLPACTDPLLPNRPELRSGQAFATGRGLRATATAICSLYASDMLAPEVLKRSLHRPRKLQFTSLEEWESAFRCSDVGAGWQVFKFRPRGRERENAKGVITGADIVGYGHADGVTGSVALHVQDISIAVLLNGVRAIDEEPHQIGHELLTIIANHLDLEPLWHLEVPKVPKKTVKSHSKKPKEHDDLREAIARLEAQLSQVVGTMGTWSSNIEDDTPGMEFVGTWNSIEIVGLEALLESFEVPAALHFMAKRATRTLHVQLHNQRFHIVSVTSVAGRSVEDTADFMIGETFTGNQQLGGDFEGIARWDGNGEDEQTTLIVEKRFMVDSHELVLEERLSLNSRGLLEVVTACHGLKEVEGSAKVIFERQDGVQMKKIKGLDSQDAKGAVNDVANACDSDACLVRMPCGSEWVTFKVSLPITRCFCVSASNCFSALAHLWNSRKKS